MQIKQCVTIAHLLGWPKSRTLTTPNAGEDVERQELSFMAGGDAEWCSHSGRQFCVLLPHNPAIMLLGIYPNKLKTYIHIKTCT